MPLPNTPIEQLKNLGPASAKQLAQINIMTYQQLANKGAIACYASLLKLDGFSPNINLLYALLGAIDDQHWTMYAKEKGDILFRLESYLEIESKFQNQEN